MQWAKERMWDGTRGAPTSPADHEPEFEEGKSLERHKGLRKHVWAGILPRCTSVI